MTNKIEKLGLWAEKKFSILCSEGGITANKSDEDDTGWDYLLEFPQAAVKGLPPDLQKIELSARAQVKSRERGKLIAKLKLSNAHRFAAAPEPCFLILAAATDGRHPVKFFAKHFWREDIARTLKRLRQADHKSKPTNRQSFDVSFNDADDHTDDLVQWMRQVVASGGSDYAERKRELNKNLGYENGQFFGTITFLSNDIEKFVDHSIGLNAKIELTNARLVDRRFGIEAKKPIFDIRPHYVEMRTHPKPCTVEVTDADDQVHCFDGEFFTPGIPGLPLDMLKARIVAGPLSALLLGTGNANFNYHFNSGDKHDLEYLTRCVKLLAAFGKGPMQVSVVFDGNRVDSGQVTTERADNAELFSDALVLLNALSRAAEKAGNPKIKLSLDDIIQGWDVILEFRNLLDADTMDFSMEGEEGRIAKAKIDRLVTGLNLTIEGYRITVVLAYRLKGDEVENQKRKLTFLKPTILRSIIDKHDEAAHGTEVQKEIERYADRHGEGVITIHRTDEGAGFVISVVNQISHN